MTIEQIKLKIIDHIIKDYFEFGTESSVHGILESISSVIDVNFDIPNNNEN